MAHLASSDVMVENKRSRSQDSPTKFEDDGSVEIDHVAEKKLVRKLDLYIIPVVMLLYLLSFLDRYADVKDAFKHSHY